MSFFLQDSLKLIKGSKFSLSPWIPFFAFCFSFSNHFLFTIWRPSFSRRHQSSGLGLRRLRFGLLPTFPALTLFLYRENRTNMSPTTTHMQYVLHLIEVTSSLETKVPSHSHILHICFPAWDANWVRFVIPYRPLAAFFTTVIKAYVDGFITYLEWDGMIVIYFSPCHLEPSHEGYTDCLAPVLR